MLASKKWTCKQNW